VILIVAEHVIGQWLSLVFGSNSAINGSNLGLDYKHWSVSGIISRRAFSSFDQLLPLISRLPIPSVGDMTVSAPFSPISTLCQLVFYSRVASGQAP